MISFCFVRLWSCAFASLGLPCMCRSFRVLENSRLEFIAEEINHYWIQVLCRVPEALDKDQIALDKAFVECGTRQRTHGKALFAECLLSGTRQRLCECPGDTQQRKATVTAPIPLTVTLPSPTGTRQRFFIFFLKKIFAECQPSWHSTKRLLCRVSSPDTRQTIFFFTFYLQTFFYSPHTISGTPCSNVAHSSDFFYISLIYFI